jgi:hypothetical protein
MPRNALLLISLGILMSSIKPAWAQTAVQTAIDPAAKAIFDRHAKLVARTSPPPKYRHTVVEISMGESKSSVESFVQLPDKILNVTTMPGIGTNEAGYDGKIGWSVSPMTGAVPLIGAPLQQLKVSIRFNAAQVADSNYTRLLKLPRDSIDGRAVNPVLTVAANRDSATYYFDAQSGLLSAMRVFRAGGQPSDSATLMLFGDYRKVDGALMPTKLTVRVRRREIVTQTTVYDHAPIDSAKFIAPAALRELANRPP